jgi:uncharacterized protein YcnI
MKKPIALVPLCCALAAQAHVVLEYQVAPASARYKATFQVGHGCGTSATRQLAVDIPQAMQGAHPMPKPGWRINLQKSDSGKVTRVTWTALAAQDKLPADFYDEFVLVAYTPAEAGPVYWPVAQVCDDARADWVEVPRDGQKLSELKHPAALLEVLPAEGGATVHHHH